jgi:regulator of sirC expression with transglutaminase-like and TPR domain
VLGVDDLQRLLQRVAAQSSASIGEAQLKEQLVPATPRAILLRWLMNLRGVYLQRGDRARALLVLDRLVSLSRNAPWALRERGVLAAKLGAVESGRADLERALANASGKELEQVKEDLAKLPAPTTLN